MTSLHGPVLQRPPHAGTGGVVLALTAMVLVLVATPAAAHPFLRGGGEVPVDTAATITLDLAHGCGFEAEGGGQDTLEVALEVPSWLRVLEVAEHPAYRHDLEVAEGRVAVVTWTAVGSGEPAPAFVLDVAATGTAGEPRHLAVFQGCRDGSHRWIGTPQEPADEPAIDVRLTAPDPARPVLPEVTTEEVPPGGPPDEAAGGAAPGDDVSASIAGAAGSDGTTGDGRLSTAEGLALLVAAVGVGLAVLAVSGRGRGDTHRNAPS